MKTEITTTPAPAPGTVNLPAPERGYMYVQVPEDLRKSTFALPGLFALCRLEQGGLMDELNDKLAKVVAKCMTFGKKGSVTLAIHFKPEGAKKMEIVAKLDAKPPKESPHSTYLFATERGQLLAKDPDQRELDLRIIEMPEPDRRAARNVLDDDD